MPFSGTILHKNDLFAKTFSGLASLRESLKHRRFSQDCRRMIAPLVPGDAVENAAAVKGAPHGEVEVEEAASKP